MQSTGVASVLMTRIRPDHFNAKHSERDSPSAHAKARQSEGPEASSFRETRKEERFQKRASACPRFRVSAFSSCQGPEEASEGEVGQGPI